MRRALIAPLLLLFAALIPTIFLGAYFYNNWAALAVSCEKGADHELMGIAVELAKKGEALTGPYSRFGFRHPGPLLPYWYAAFETLLPLKSTPMGLHLMAQATLNALLMCIAGWWCARFLRPRWIALLPFPLSYPILWGEGGPFFHDYWNPSVTMAPMLVAVLAASGIGLGSLGWILPFAGAAAILCSSHLGSLPLVAALGVTALLLLLRRGLRKALIIRHRWHLAAALGIVFIAILPVAVDAMTQPGFGNVGAILRFQSTLNESKGLGDSIRFVGSYFAKGIFAGLSPTSALLLTQVILIALAFCLRGVRKNLAIICASASLAAIVSATRIAGNFEPYLLRSMFGVVAASQLLFAVVALDLARRYSPQTWHLRPLLGSGAALVISLLCLWALFPKTFTPRPQICGQIAAPFIEALAPLSSASYRLEIGDQEAWPFAAPFALALLRQGSEVCVDEKWRYLFDTALTCSWKGARSASFQTVYLYRNIPANPPTTSHSFKGPLNWMLW